ncbi:MAG TPA: hypothetical protein VFD22_12265, partial [Gemmatimonadaceae bacterium]|nr:hypothetical protein [Gemmatimonadaceae bacterium]
AFVAGAVHRFARRGAENASSIDRLAKMSFFAFVAVFPIAVAVALRPTVYDSTRLFLFVMPPLAIVAGIGLNWFFTLRLPKILKVCVTSILVVDALLVLADMVALHPYQYAYFNRISGGVRGAYGVYDMEYWGTSYKEGVEWLEQNYKRSAPRASIRVANPSNPFLTYYYLHTSKPEVQRFTPVDIDDSPDVVLSLTRWNQHIVYEGRVLHIVQRSGAPFLYILETSSRDRSEDSTMRAAVRSLYIKSEPWAAERDFRRVLELDPQRYGAIQGLASALDATGKSGEARRLWAQALLLAKEFNDTRTVELATNKLAEGR